MANYLPRDLWLQILSKLEKYDLESVSLVCKDFLSISNNFRRRISFKVTDDSMQILSKLVDKYPALQGISLTMDDAALKKNCGATMFSAIYEIGRSRLDIRFLNVSCPCDYESLVKCIKYQGPSMKNLQTLILSVCEIYEHNLQQIGKSFPSLKQLVIRKRCYDHMQTAGISDDVVKLLTSKLEYLEKIALPADPPDKFVIAISSKCSLLKEVAFHLNGFIKISGNAIGDLLQKSPDLIPLSMSDLKKLCYTSLKEIFSFTGENSTNAEKLQDIDISCVEIRQKNHLFWVIITCSLSCEKEREKRHDDHGMTIKRDAEGVHIRYNT